MSLTADGSSPVAAVVAETVEQAFDAVEAIDVDELERVAEGLQAVRARGGRLFILGVGGSAGHASHAVNERSPTRAAPVPKQRKAPKGRRGKVGRMVILEPKAKRGTTFALNGGAVAIGATAYLVLSCALVIIGVVLAGMGMPQAYGKLLGWLLICTPAAQSGAELVAALGLSKGSVSAGLRTLVAPMSLAQSAKRCRAARSTPAWCRIPRTPSGRARDCTSCSMARWAPWCNAEDNFLLLYWLEGKPLKQIGQLLKREYGSLERRAWAITTRYGTASNYESKRHTTRAGKKVTTRDMLVLKWGQDMPTSHLAMVLARTEEEVQQMRDARRGRPTFT